MIALFVVSLFLALTVHLIYINLIETKKKKKGSRSTRTEVAAIEALCLSDVGAFGGKAANLGELSRIVAVQGVSPLPGYHRETRTRPSESTSYVRSNDLVSLQCSSAVGEDGASASFAGQLETYLGVYGRDAVVEAVQKCWASASTDRVQAYSTVHK